MGVGDGQAFARLEDEVDRLGHRQRSALGGLRPEVAPLEQFEHHVGRAVVEHAGALDAHHVGARELLQGRGLAHDAGTQVVDAHERGGHHLDGDVVAAVEPRRAVHVAHAAVAEPLAQDEAAVDHRAGARLGARRHEGRRGGARAGVLRGGHGLVHARRRRRLRDALDDAGVRVDHDVHRRRARRTQLRHARARSRSRSRSTGTAGGRMMRDEARGMPVPTPPAAAIARDFPARAPHPAAPGASPPRCRAHGRASASRHESMGRYGTRAQVPTSARGTRERRLPAETRANAASPRRLSPSAAAAPALLRQAIHRRTARLTALALGLARLEARPAH